METTTEKGRGLVVTRDIEEGETLLCEPPLVFAPDAFGPNACWACARLLTDPELYGATLEVSEHLKKLSLQLYVTSSPIAWPLELRN